MKSPVGFGPVRFCCVLTGASWVWTSDISTSSFVQRVSVRSGADRGRRLLSLLLRGVENLLEPAPEHALSGEGHFALRLEALVRHDRLPRLVADRFAGPFDEGEDHAFAFLGLHRAIEVGDLAFRDVVAESFDDASRAVCAEHLGHLGRELAISLTLAVRDGDDEAVGVATAWRPFLDDRLEAAEDHPLAVEGHRGELLLDAWVAHHPVIGGVARLAVRIFEPGEDD